MSKQYRNINEKITNQSSKLIRDTIFNLMGSVIPIIVAIITIPILIQGIGTDRFGILTIIWMFIGYFSLFDFGLGRALTQLVSKELGAGRNGDLSRIIWNTLILMLIMGFLGSIVLVVSSSLLIQYVLKISNVFKSETLKSIYLISLLIPFVTTIAGMKGLLEAYLRFDIINTIRVPVGILVYAGPVLILSFSNNLVSIICVIGLIRFLEWVTYIIYCLKIVPQLRSFQPLEWSIAKKMLKFGGWMTVTNIVSPIMVYLDRFLIGVLVSMSAVTYYTTPYEIVSKLGIITTAMIGVLFPNFSKSFLTNIKETKIFFRRGLNYIGSAMFPLMVIVIIFAPEGLNWWLGADFANNSVGILRWLSIGIFINGLANVPFAMIQAAGRPDITARLHLFELPIYLFLLYYFLDNFGLDGVAMAWTLRVTIDMLLLFMQASKMLNDNKILPYVALIFSFSAIFVFPALLINSVILKCFFSIGFLAIHLLIVWLFVFEIREREYLLSKVKLI